jgi:predicted RNA-binding protein with PUA-like domain
MRFIQAGLLYDLGLYYGSTAPEQSVRGLVQMRAKATQSLSRFNLDYASWPSTSSCSTRWRRRH